VLNFGLQAPIDIQIAGQPNNAANNEAIARKIMTDVRKVPGIVDVRLQQVPRTPDVRVDVDRTLASQLGVTQKDVASDLLISLSSSNQTAPNFWLDPSRGVNYSIFVQTPQYRMDSINTLENTPIVPRAGGVAPTPENMQLLGNLAQTRRSASPTSVTHYDIVPTYDVLTSVASSDLGSAARGIEQVIAKYQGDLKGGSRITLAGRCRACALRSRGWVAGSFSPWCWCTC
jgi:multidrug efflux pump subunit AcrB